MPPSRPSRWPPASRPDRLTEILLRRPEQLHLLLDHRRLSLKKSPELYTREALATTAGAGGTTGRLDTLRRWQHGELLRIALRLRGSRAGEVWLLLLGGFVFLCAGDACFAYFQSLGEVRLDPYVHGTYLLAYGLIAGGAHRQLELLKP